MSSRKIYLDIILRVIAIVVVSLLIGWLAYRDFALPGIVFLGIFFLGQVIELISYLNRTNRKIAFFFDAIRNEDSTLYFPETQGSRSLNELNASLNKTNELIKVIKFELREQEQYFKAILEHVSIGIITFNERGNIFLSNQTAKALLNYEHLTHIEQILRVDKKLYQAFRELRPGDHKLVNFSGKQGIVQLSLKSTLFKTSQESFQLVAIQDIKNELEAKELESWIKLIRVLTHEIMNTVAPITSLSETLLGYFKNQENLVPEEKIIRNTVKGLEVINERGAGLIGFVETYRKLTRVPQPDKKPINLNKLFDQMVILLNTEQSESFVAITWSVIPPDLEILADKKQISQVLINLLKNSIEALTNTNKPAIKVEAIINGQGRPQISVTDNGPGIPDDLMDKIFIPFFTTKETGSGIGLSLSRQIMQFHGGSLKIVSQPGKSTSAIMIF
jgi:nitrogen fixation/metabolism regulation signal transduction histidine kinase